MAAKFVILACALAAANAGYIGAPVAQYAVPHAVTSTSDNIIRSPGNLAQVATQTKTITTPYSSSSKSDVRVSNPGVYTHAAPVAYAHAPVAHAPVAYAHGPVAHAPVAYAHGPVAHAPVAYAHGPVAHAPVAYAHGPVAHGSPVAYSAGPVVSSHVGIGYSPAVAVSHVSYSSPVGVSYGW